MSGLKEGESDVQENPHAPVAAPTQSMEGAVLVGESSPVAASSSEPETIPAAPGALQENPHPPVAAPTQSMEGALLAGESSPVAAPSSPETIPAAPGALQENPHPPAAAPSEDHSGSVLVDAAPAPAAAAAPPVPATPTAAELARPVRTLPRRPRLRCTCSYDASDNMSMELTLMDEKRELIHRMTLTPSPDSPLGRIFQALVSVAAHAAAATGVFGAVPSSQDKAP